MRYARAVDAATMISRNLAESVLEGSSKESAWPSSVVRSTVISRSRKRCKSMNTYVQQRRTGLKVSRRILAEEIEIQN